MFPYPVGAPIVRQGRLVAPVPKDNLHDLGICLEQTKAHWAYRGPKAGRLDTRLVVGPWAVRIATKLWAQRNQSAKGVLNGGRIEGKAHIGCFSW